MTQSLERYRDKRDFRRSSEPRGAAKPGKRASKDALSFVVHKHAARTLHYDFRLELDGVLLSWAVPKGPSTDPKDKCLAVETEPHPLEYGEFEGTIAEGEYGAGEVEIWDRGSWTPEGDPRVAYQDGKLSFRLDGNRLQGNWHLVRTKNGSKKSNQWLLFKARDTAKADQEGAPAAASPPPRAKPKEKAARAKAPVSIPAEPELATLVSSAPEGVDWVHELKFDGYRLLARLQNESVRLFTRNGNDWTEKLPTLSSALEKLPVSSALIDGELVALDERGVSDFQTLQNSLTAGREGALVYYAFDLLEFDGEDQRELPLVTRKQTLLQLFEKHQKALGPNVRPSKHATGRGPEFFARACQRGAEGIVSKRALSPYRSGRGGDWVKVKCTKRQEFVIVGYTEPRGSRAHLGALLLAVSTDSGLSYVGRVGTGFTEQSLAELRRRLEPLAAERTELENAPRGAHARGVHWVRPELVAEVGFTSRTEDGLLRHPTFLGLREDKPVAEVRTEFPVESPTVSGASARSEAASSSRSARRTEVAGSSRSATRSGAARSKAAVPARSAAPKRALSYPLTNPDKVLYPQDGITKRELLEYYELVAERMLPHVRNRPLTVVRCPDGLGSQCFFQKHPREHAPEGIRWVSIREKEGKAPYAVVDNEQGLFSLIQLAALEIHTWGAPADDHEHPNILVFDLDPDPELDFSAVIACARELKKVFEGAGLESFVKTGGGKGLHVCVPIQPELGWDAIKGFTQRVAEDLVAQAPSKYVATASKAKRKGKIFIDYLRNGRGATFVAPYSTRAREHAPVAMPLEWDELTPDFHPEQVTLRTLRKRIAEGAPDPFARMAELAPSLPRVLAKGQGLKALP